MRLSVKKRECDILHGTEKYNDLTILADFSFPTKN